MISDFTGLHRCEVHERVARDLPDQYRLLTQEATLDTELGEALWRDYDPHVRGQITLMMVHLGLAVHLRSGQYLIPALLPPESSQSSQQTPHDHHDSVRIRRSCLFHFRIRTGRVEGAGARVGGQACGLLVERDLYGGFMPDGLFARVVAKCVGWSESTYLAQGRGQFKPTLTKRWVRLTFGCHEFSLTELPEFNSIQVQVTLTQACVISRLKDLIKEVIDECFDDLICKLLVPVGGINDGHVELDHIEQLIPQPASQPEPVQPQATQPGVMRTVTIGHHRFTDDDLLVRFGFWLPDHLRPSYDLFFSYRPSTHDSDLTGKLFDCMMMPSDSDTTTQVTWTAFLDQRCLRPGQQLAPELLRGLWLSKAVCVVVSPSALEPMTRVTAESPVDTVLLMWAMIAELAILRPDDFLIIPLLFGHVSQSPTDGRVMVSDVLTDRPRGAPSTSPPLVDLLPDLAVHSVATMVQHFLTRCHVTPSPDLHRRTVRQMFHIIKDCMPIQVGP